MMLIVQQSADEWISESKISQLHILNILCSLMRWITGLLRDVWVCDTASLTHDLWPPTLRQSVCCVCVCVSCPEQSRCWRFDSRPAVGGQRSLPLSLWHSSSSVSISCSALLLLFPLNVLVFHWKLIDDFFPPDFLQSSTTEAVFWFSDVAGSVSSKLPSELQCFTIIK